MSFEVDAIGDLVWRNKKGQWHREEGPDVICTNGHIQYCFNNELHRLDGPAIIYPNGSKSYFIHGKGYSKEEYYVKVKEL